MEGAFDARSVTYFPSPDTPTGTLTILYSLGASKMGLLRLYWSHGNVFG